MKNEAQIKTSTNNDAARDAGQINIGDRGQYPNGFCWTVESVQGDAVIILDDGDDRATLTAAKAAAGIAALEALKASWVERDARDEEKAARVAAEKAAKIEGSIAKIGDGDTFVVEDDSDESYSGIRVCAPDGEALLECRVYGLRKEWLGSKSRSELVAMFSLL